jgi:hypothetical protein
MWNPFTIVDASHDDPTIYPVLSAPQAQLPIELDQHDGQPAGFQPKAMRIMTYTGQGWTRTWQDKDLDFVAVVTMSRIVFYCEKYTKGGGWRGFGVGGLLVAGAANVVSHAAAASRRKGKILAGQIRYPWLNQVVATDTQAGGQLRLGMATNNLGHQQHLAVEMDTDRKSNATATAQHIVRAAAYCRLTYGPALPQEHQALYRALAENPGSGTDPAQPGIWDLPATIYVGAPGSIPNGAGLQGT